MISRSLAATSVGQSKRVAPTLQPNPSASREIVGEAAGVDQQLFGHAAADDAGSADAEFLRHDHLRAVLGGDARRPNAARSGADDEEIDVERHRANLSPGSAPCARTLRRGARSQIRNCSPFSSFPRGRARGCRSTTWSRQARAEMARSLDRRLACATTYFLPVALSKKAAVSFSSCSVIRARQRFRRVRQDALFGLDEFRGDGDQRLVQRIAHLRMRRRDAVFEFAGQPRHDLIEGRLDADVEDDLVGVAQRGGRRLAARCGGARQRQNGKSGERGC